MYDGAAPTVAIETHGCKLNQADTSVMALEFAGAGFRLVSPDEPADVFVVNTCTVTHVADRKARQALRSARRRNPAATVVAAGCYPERARADLEGLSEVDLVFGNSDKSILVRRVTERMGARSTAAAMDSDVGTAGQHFGRTRAMVKIQEGCDQVCAYCIVPKVRGRERSVPPDAMVRQVEERLSQGFKEVVLTGTQLGTYGFELGDTNLATLVRRILRETAVERLRVSSLQPQEISRELLDLWSDPRLCPHFHMPLQSGSDPVLSRMRRRYTSQEYSDAVGLVRGAVPRSSVTTDVIVGFPGEGDAEFAETYSLAEEVGFAATHVFPYSPRPGTSAARFSEQVAPQTKSERVSRLMALSARKSAEFREAMLGEVRPVLWEERRGNGHIAGWSGLTDNYVRVLCASDRDLSNSITLATLRARQDDVVVADVEA